MMTPLAAPAPHPLQVIKQKMALGLKLKGQEMHLMEQMSLRHRFKLKERMHHDGERLSIKKTIDSEPVIHGVRGMSELVNAQRNKQGWLYLGSIDILTAQNWAKECGHAVGTKGFSAYAKKKLQSGDFNKFKAEKYKRLY